MKKILSLLLTVVMMAATVPMTTVEVSAAGEVKAKLDAVIKKYPHGSKWSGSYGGASQCMGFARLVVTTVFGEKGGDARKWSYSGENRNGMRTIDSVKAPFTADKIKNLLSKAKSGDVLQFDEKSTSVPLDIHSVVVYDVDSKGAKLYDCNRIKSNTVALEYKTFSQIAGWQKNSPKLTLLRSDNYDDIENLPELTVSFHANGGTVSSSIYKLGADKLVCRKDDNSKYQHIWPYGTKRAEGLVNASTLGLIRPGYSFKGWGTKSSGGTVFDENDKTLLPEEIDPNLKNGDRSITLYAIWNPNVLTVSYHANGGVISSDTYKLTGDLVYKKSSNAKLADTWTYGTERPNGPYNASTFGLSRIGYSFAGWSTSSSGVPLFDENDGTILAEHINPVLAKGNCTSTLYAIWKPNTYTVTYQANGGTGTTASSTHTYDTAKALTANGFKRTGYTFLGWSTNRTASSAAYSDRQSVKNLTALNGGTITLYAVWRKNPVILSSISIHSRPDKTVYYTGERLDPKGLSIKAIMSDGTSSVLSSGFTLSSPNMSSAGVKTVTVTYQGKTATFEVTVKSRVPASITSSTYSISGGFISKIGAGTTVSQLLNGINEKAYCKVYKGNSEVSGSTLIGTGMTVKLLDGSTVKQTLTIAVTGDTNGDGNITITDMLAVKSHLLKKSTLTGAAAKAADTSGDKAISITDFIQIKAHILGKDKVQPRAC